MESIFRQSQIDKLQSPDQLDKMMVITPPSFWIALLSGILIIITALVWSLKGEIPQKVEANGIIMTDQNAYTLSSEINGVVSEIKISIGQSISAGDVMYLLDTKSLEKEKAELEERKDIVASVTLTSTGDVSNSDTQSLLEIKSQIAGAGSQVSQNETMLAIREAELQQQKEVVSASAKVMNDARLALESYQNEHSAITGQYDTVNQAWSNVMNYRSAMDASANVMQEAKDNLDFYVYYAESGDPEERAQYDAAYNTYTSSVSTYYTNKTQYETAINAYNALLETYFTDAQPSVAPEKQIPPLVTYVNAYNTAVSELQTKYEAAKNSYSTEYQRQTSLESEIASLKVQIAAGEDGEGTSVESYKKQFEASKEAVIASLDTEIAKYDDNIENSEVKSSVSGIVSDIKMNVGSMVTQGAGTVVIRKGMTADDTVYCYVPLSTAMKIEPGMDVKVYPTIVNRQEYGNLVAVVTNVADFVTSQAQLQKSLGDDSLASAFTSNGPVVGVICRLEEDSSSASGYQWSSEKGKELKIPQGTLVEADIIVEYKKPITMLIPYLKDKFNSYTTKESEEKN